MSNETIASTRLSSQVCMPSLGLVGHSNSRRTTAEEAIAFARAYACLLVSGHALFPVVRLSDTADISFRLLLRQPLRIQCATERLDC